MVTPQKSAREVTRGKSSRTPVWIFSGVALVVGGVAALLIGVALLVWLLG